MALAWLTGAARIAAPALSFSLAAPAPHARGGGRQQVGPGAARRDPGGVAHLGIDRRRRHRRGVRVGQAEQAVLEVVADRQRRGVDAVAAQDDHRIVAQVAAEIRLESAVAADVRDLELAGGALADRPAVAVVGMRPPSLRDVRPDVLLALRPRQHRIAGQRQVPAVEVAGRRQDAAVAAQVPPGAIRCPRMVERRSPVAVGGIAVRQQRERPGRQPESGVPHARRPEQPPAQEVVVGAAGCHLHHHRQHAEAAVRVAVPAPGGTQQPRGEDPPQQLRPGDRLVLLAEGVAQPRGVGEELVQRDRRLVGRRAGEEAAQGVLDLELALHLEREDRRGGELLRDRGDVEQGLGGVRTPPRTVGQAVPLVQQHPPAPGHQHRARITVGGEPRHVPVELGAHRIARHRHDPRIGVRVRQPPQPPRPPRLVRQRQHCQHRQTSFAIASARDLSGGRWR